MEKTIIKNVNVEEVKFGTMKKIAEKLEIKIDGLSLQELADQINAEIEKRGGEVEIDLEEVNSVENQSNASENSETAENQNSDETLEEKKEEAPAKAPKWYENGYGNKPGDRVTIIGKHIHTNTDNPKVILQGRTAVIIEPSRKVDTVRAKLLDANGNEQGCIITLKKGEYADEGTVEVPIPPRKTRKKDEKVETPVEQVEQNETTSNQPENNEQQAS